MYLIMDTDRPFIFKNWLKRLREATGLSYPDLAKLSGLSKGHISNLEKGEREPTDDTLEKLGPALGVPVEWLKAMVDMERLGDEGIERFKKYYLGFRGITRYKSMIETLEKGQKIYLKMIQGLDSDDEKRKISEGYANNQRLIEKLNGLVERIQNQIPAETPINSFLTEIHQDEQELNKKSIHDTYWEDLINIVDDDARLVSGIDSDTELGKILSIPGARLIIGEDRPKAALPFAGQVGCGRKLELYPSQVIKLPEDVAAKGDFACEAIGDSMNRARIEGGDILIVRKQDWADHGDIVIAHLRHDGHTCKRYKIRSEGAWLEPESYVEGFESLKVDVDVTIIGVVTYIHRVGISLKG